MASVPAVRLTLPVNVFAAFRASVPGPALVSVLAVAPLMTPPSVAVTAALDTVTVAGAVRDDAPLNERLLVAAVPPNVKPPPTFTPLARVRAAVPALTVPPEIVSAPVPSAALLSSTRLPDDIVVPPVYVFVPLSVRVPAWVGVSVRARRPLTLPDTASEAAAPVTARFVLLDSTVGAVIAFAPAALVTAAGPVPLSGERVPPGPAWGGELPGGGGGAVLKTR